jgi:hypothetical protein
MASTWNVCLFAVRQDSAGRWGVPDNCFTFMQAGYLAVGAAASVLHGFGGNDSHEVVSRVGSYGV